MKKKILIIPLCVLMLLMIFVILNKSSKDSSKLVVYDTNAEDSPHYEIGEKIKVGKSNFVINDYKLSYDENDLINYKLVMDIDKINYENLANKYTFMLANNDELITKTNCSYEDNTINVVEIEKSSIDNPNQIVILDNKEFEILATINLNVQK